MEQGDEGSTEDITMERGSPTPTNNAEKIACDRCRQRKIRCGRGQPCLQCSRTESQCTYLIGQRQRPKRQRIRISDDLESNVHEIANKLDELTQMVSELKQAQTKTVASGSASLLSRPMGQPARDINSAAAPSSSTTENRLNGGISDEGHSAEKTEYEGESSLFGHAQFAASFLQAAIGSSPSPDVKSEMSSVVDTLKDIVDSQKQKSDTAETAFPHARPLPVGSNLRYLPMPSADKIFACLRRIQETEHIQGIWILEFQSLGQFTDYVFRVCSPGPATEAEQIIAYAGLYWLFYECSSVSENEELRSDYETQASICRDNLETLLLHLRFHCPATMDYVYAMSMAATYCLQTFNLTSAWMFICTAIHFAQSLGLQSAIPLNPETEEKRRQKQRLFWSLYSTERIIALRIGRSSTIRDIDITVPPLKSEGSSDTLMNQLLPVWIDMAALQGRLYDEIYSPAGLSQPEHVRVARAQSLATGVKRMINMEQQIEAGFKQRQGSQNGHLQLVWASDRLLNLSVLVLVYRSIPSDKPGLLISDECIMAARQALKELVNCVAIRTEEAKKSTFIDLYVNWSLLQSPFIAFTALFCHIIEASDATDLDRLRQSIEALEELPDGPHQAPTSNFLRLFKALYGVAVKYISVQTNSTADARENTASPGTFGGLGTTTTGAADVPGMGSFAMPHGEFNYQEQLSDPTMAASVADASNQSFGYFSTAINPETANLGSWFSTNYQLLRMLEDA